MNDGSIKIGVDLDTTNLEKGLNNVAKDNRKTFEQISKDTGKSVEDIKKEVKKLAEEYQKQGMNIPLSYKKAYKELGILAKKNADEVSEQAEKISDSYEKSSNKISNSLKKGFAGLGGAAKSGFANLGNVSTTVFSATTKAITGVSAGITGLGAASVVVGKEFESAMSKVQATSGASTEDLEKLKQTALEMGSTTKFSATESAEALNYMAMAGWKTEQMIGGIGGIMDLAAASGEDLAMVSDIVTDGLTAFGMTANESGRFADVLAAASSNANTNVAMLGESFKYVAPVAGALGYSIEDTSVALGLMANAGIKASNSGTALRTLMTNLASPTKSSAVAIEELGINIQDAQGNMLPFNDVMAQLRDGFNGLTEAEKAQYAEMLAGKEGMSGLLAIVNASQVDFDKLTGAINNSSGAANEMANIMSDNLQGQLDELSSRLETLGISIYDKIQEPLKEVTKYTIGLISQLQEAFNKGGFEGLINSLGNIFSQALTDLAEKAPQVIDLASQFILNFLNGINQNSQQLGQSGAQILTSFINGIFEILPEFIETAASLIINFQEGIIKNLPKLLETGKRMLETLSKSITDNLPIILKNGIEILMQLVNGLIDNLPLIIDTGIDIILALVDSLVDSLPELIPAAVEAILTIVDALIDNLDKIIDAAIDLILALTDGLIDAIPLLIEKVPVIITKLILALTAPEMLLKLLDAGMQLIISLIDGFIKMNMSLLQAGWDIVKTVAKAIIDAPGEMIEAGKDLIRGLIDGIKSMASEVYNTMKNFANGVVSDVKSFFGIHSPSRVFRDEIGIWLPLGMAQGINSKATEVVRAIIYPIKKAEEEIKKEKNVLSKNLANTITEATKKATKESKNFGETGEILITSLTDNIDSNKENAINSMDTLIKDMLKSSNETIDAESKTLIENYTNTINEQIKNETLSKEAGKKLIKDYTDSVKSTASEEKESIKAVGTEMMNSFKESLETGANQANQIIEEKLGTLSQTFQSEMDSLISAQENLQSKLGDAKLFEFEDNELIIQDLDETINKLNEYDTAIAQLKEKGISDAILDELAGYSVDEVLKISETLLKMTDEEFAILNEKWAEKQATAATVASNFYKEQMAILEKDFNDELIKVLDELPDQVEDIGIMTITGFEEGLSSKFDSIREEARSFADSIISEMQRALDIHSPSRKARWLGEMTMDGYGLGVVENSKKVIKSINKIPFFDTFKEQVAKTKVAVNMGVNSMIPKSSYVTNNTSNSRVNNTYQGDLIFNVSGMTIRSDNDIKAIAQELYILQNSRNLAKGGV